DPDRTEPVTEVTNAVLELGDRARPLARQLGRELEPVRHLLSPAPELFLGRQPVPGRVQLDRREALGVEGEEARRVQPGRVEAGPPARIRPARGADRYAVYCGRSLGHGGEIDIPARAVHGGRAGAARSALHASRPARLSRR